MKKWSNVLLSLTLAAALLTGCAPKQAVQEGGKYTAGTFTGASENGKGGKLEVTAEFSSDAIISLVVSSHNETPNISDVALEQIPQEIVEYQSLKIDSISGATITCVAILEAAEAAIKQAGGDVEALKAAETGKEKSEEVIELETELVIVGAGAAGMAAAVSAADEGAGSVIVFEKQSNIGGNAIVSGGFVENLGLENDLRADNDAGYESRVEAVVNGGPQNEDEEQHWEQFTQEFKDWQATDRSKVFDSPLWMAIDGARTDGGEIADYLHFVQSLQEFDDWMEGMGAQWEKQHGIVGYSWPRWTNIKDFYLGEGFFHYFEKTIADKNYPIEIYTGTPVTELVVDETGAVTGVIAKAASGETYKVKATQGVILASGGFAGNGEMLVEYNQMWEGLTADVLTTNTAGATGDGIIMAQKIGAAVDAMEAEMMFPMAAAKTGSIEGIVGNSPSCLMVNKEGLRFVNETGTRWDISAAMFEQTDDLAYMISSQENSKIKGDKTEGGTLVQSMLDGGALYMADTLEELAGKIGIAPEVLKSTVESYNKMTETNTDADFGRTTFEPNSAITGGPYYAYPCMPAAHITIGGVVINYDTLQVVNTDGADIPYLFAAGEVVAGECGIDGSFAQGKGAAQYIVHNVEKRNMK